MKTLVIGMGKSGRGAARFLLKQGHEVVAVDSNPFKMEGVRPLSAGERFDLVILSPGVPPSHIEAQRECEVIGEAELAFRNMKNRCIGITGTNGKSTLTLLITHILNHAGVKARALGNVGESLSDYLLDPDPEEVVVAELSSFQLETMRTRAIDHGVILNITPDHLDRYPSFEAYARTKCRLGELIKGELVITEEVEKEFGSFLPRGKVEVVNSDSYLQLTNEERYWRIIGYDKVLSAFAICKKFGLSWEIFKRGCETFHKPRHRLEFIGEVAGVRYYDDSKGTNIEAVLYAVREVEGPICLIAGGKSKGDSFEKWKEAFQGKVRAIFAIGETAAQIEEELKSVLPVRRLQNLQEAVQCAYKEAKRGEAILLSPGCASFDQFSSFEERGEKFKECVFEITG
ncbi:MAG: UDP-N-acetylmuramoylalanine--D-glutamate ligase [Chlamydiae bacterium]|nr:UDP-N-acetylmuramoylalanine--D-glutamate ligase [Chlamydiota bacterium]